MSSIQEEAQKLDADAVVTLFRLDTSPIGGTDVFCFTPRTAMGGNLTHGGTVYNAIDIVASGFLFDGKGAFPQPKLQITDIGSLVTAMVVGNNDLAGCIVTRIRTFAKFLDDGSDPDPDKIWPPDVYVIDQKTKHIPGKLVEFTLASPLDQNGRKLPRRQCFRDYCTHSYRIYNPLTDTFDYATATCPYVGSNNFDENGVLTSDKSKDVCGRRITDCKARFGQAGVLPTRAFPGLRKVDV